MKYLIFKINPAIDENEFSIEVDKYLEVGTPHFETIIGQITERIWLECNEPPEVTFIRFQNNAEVSFY